MSRRPETAIADLEVVAGQTHSSLAGWDAIYFSIDPYYVLAVTGSSLLLGARRTGFQDREHESSRRSINQANWPINQFMPSIRRSAINNSSIENGRRPSSNTSSAASGGRSLVVEGSKSSVADRAASAAATASAAASAAAATAVIIPSPRCSRRRQPCAAASPHRPRRARSGRWRRWRYCGEPGHA